MVHHFLQNGHEKCASISLLTFPFLFSFFATLFKAKNGFFIARHAEVKFFNSPLFIRRAK